VSVSAGEWHSLALCANGDVWTWGRAYYIDRFNTAVNGLLGQGTSRANSYYPRRIIDITGFSGNIAYIYASNWFSVAICSDGHIWSWGRCYRLRLDPLPPYAITNPYSFRPRKSDKIEGMSRAKKFESGMNFRIICIDGNLWTWGMSGQWLGNGTYSWNYRYKPFILTNTDIFNTVIAVNNATISHTVVICNKGRLWVWGRTDGLSMGLGFPYPVEISRPTAINLGNGSRIFD